MIKLESNFKLYILYTIAIVFSLCSLLWSLSTGSITIPFYQVWNQNGVYQTIFFELRLPRTIAAFTVGGLLALAGALMQLLLNNPLADPYILGLSGGAALATLIAMLIGLGASWLLPSAFLGALSSILLIILFSRQHRWQSQQLLLFGIAISCAFSASINALLQLAPQRALPSMLFWLAGDLSNVHSPQLGLIVLIVGLLITWLLSPGFNLLARGEIAAHALGLKTTRYRCILFICSALFTASAVTLAGSIGFIGLIIPHLVRRLGCYRHQHLLPLCVLFGGTLLTVADTIARTLFAPLQLPVGIIMALIGVPVFIALLN